MYSTCLFCHGSLGRNEAIEHFPVGRRLAFDAAKGRLWVVCRRCQRWNLTPLEERWEAIEEAERHYRATRLSLSTDNVGLARLAEGTELVRIGRPLRPEMAAWRYGDQFGRRRRRHLAYSAAGVAAAGALVLAGPTLGVTTGAVLLQAPNVVDIVQRLRRRRSALRVADDDGRPLVVSDGAVMHTRFFPDGDGWYLVVVARKPRGATRWTDWLHHDVGVGHPSDEHCLTGAAARRAAAVLLPRLNHAGASRARVNDAVSLLEGTPEVERLFADAARRADQRVWQLGKHHGLMRFVPAATRLALEMAVHDDVERRALEGELAELERAWREAEEIAAIADDLLLPESVTRRLAGG